MLARRRGRQTENLEQGRSTSVQGALDKQIYFNQMGELKDKFSVRQSRGQFVITVHYERELNLLFDTKTIAYDKTVTLD